MPRLEVRTPQEISIELDDGRRFPLHPIWLRERCRDAGSMDLRTGQRLHDPSDLDPSLAITAVSEPESGRFRVTFSDGHEAEFVGRSLLEEAALGPADHDVPTPRLWSAATAGEVRRVAWVDSPPDTLLHDWLS
jgi:gamma-butyrobetaine dioxygenase